MNESQAFSSEELATIRAQIEKDRKRAGTVKTLENLIAAAGHALFAVYLVFSLLRAYSVFSALLEAAKAQNGSITPYYRVFSGVSAVILLFFLVMEGRYLSTVVRSKGEKIPAGLFPSAVYLLMLLSVASRFGIYTYPMTQIFPFYDLFLLLTAAVGIAFAAVRVIFCDRKSHLLPLLSLAGCTVIAVVLALLPIGNLLSWSVKYASGSKYAFDLTDISVSKTLSYMEVITRSAAPLETNTLPLILALGTLTVMVVIALLFAFRGKEKPKSLLVFLLCLASLLGLVIGICPPTVNVSGVANLVVDKATAALGIDTEMLESLKTGLDSLGLSFSVEDVKDLTVGGLDVNSAVTKLTSAAGSAIGGALGGEGEGLDALMGGAAGLSGLINVSGTGDIAGSLTGMFDAIPGLSGIDIASQSGDDTQKEPDEAVPGDSETDPGKNAPGEPEQKPQSGEETASTAKAGSVEDILNRVTVDADNNLLLLETDTGEVIPLPITKTETPKMESTPEKAFVCMYRDSLTGEAKGADVGMTVKLFYLLLFALLMPFMACSLLCVIYLAAVGDVERKYALLHWCRSIAIGMAAAVLLAGLFALSLTKDGVGHMADDSFSATCGFRFVYWAVGVIGFAAIAVLASIPWTVLKKRAKAIGNAFRNGEVA